MSESAKTVTQLPVTHYDETGWRVAGKLHWLHCACNEQWRYYTVQEKRGPKAKGKFRCLLERSRDFKDDILRFARDWRVPYTNNTAERAIRCARVKEKVSGCFRTISGADDFACVLSFTSSAALHGVSTFDAIVAAFRGNAVGALFGVD